MIEDAGLSSFSVIHVVMFRVTINREESKARKVSVGTRSRNLKENINNN